MLCSTHIPDKVTWGVVHQLRRSVVLEMSTICRYHLIIIMEFPHQYQPCRLSKKVQNFANVVCEQPLAVNISKFWLNRMYYLPYPPFLTQCNVFVKNCTLEKRNLGGGRNFSSMLEICQSIFSEIFWDILMEKFPFDLWLWNEQGLKE